MVISGVAVSQNSITDNGVQEIETSKSTWGVTTVAGDYEMTDTITLTLKVVDAGGIKNSSLATGNLTVYMDGIPDTSATKTVTAVQTSGDYASYNVNISGFSKSGYLSVGIASGTLTDNADKTSSGVYVATGIQIISQYTVSYNTKTTAVSTPEDQIVNEGEKITLPVLSNYRNAFGTCTFLGWRETSDRTGTLYPGGGTYTPVNDVTLYADWNIAGLD